MGVNKIPTFLYVKTFIVSICLFVSYLILEQLSLHMTFYNFPTPFYSLWRHITP